MLEELILFTNKLSFFPERVKKALERLDKNGCSVFRNVFQKLRNEIGESLQELGKMNDIKIERMGEKFEEPKEKIKVDKERLKKRVKGLIKIQGSIPIDKLAIALKKSEEFAENLIYELASEEGVEGTIEDGVFKFSSNQEKIISILENLMDNME
ncbi:MAG: hypothetical protein ACTSWY_11410 [Promethearchaeota archaeon]